ncbi:MAG: DNA alkylation repair protein [Candidatus Pacearchaeota archaeon]|jgi:3-methyladenine DNA glycosylase AlkD
MVYKSKKQLKKLSDKQFFEDIKKYIKSYHSFYESRVPELKVLANRLHEEYDLKEFYKVFNKFWNSGYNEERTLAVHTLQLYKEDFDINTWRFLKPKLKDIKSWDKVDRVSSNIIGEILVRERKLEKEIIALAKSNNIWFKRMAIMATVPLIKLNNNELSLQICEFFIHDKDKQIQEAVGLILREIGEQKPAVAKKFILKNIHMPILSFDIATQNMKELRKLRDVKKLGRETSIVKSIKNIFRR